jgi:hypothetical protein
MKAFIVTIDSKVQDPAYTSLTNCCARYDIPYSSASKGKRKFIINNEVRIITQIAIQKTKRK